MENYEIRAQLGRIVTDPLFGSNRRLTRFLTYIVEETLSGQADRIKGYAIALSVFDRDESFDSNSDSIVRVEAIRLRKQLATYYKTTGKNDPVVIEVPLGGYVPQFRPVPSDFASRWMRIFQKDNLVPKGVVAAVLLSTASLASQYVVPYFGSNPAATEIKSATRGMSALVLGDIDIVASGERSALLGQSLSHQLKANLSKFQQVRVFVTDGAQSSSMPMPSAARLDTQIHQHDDKWHINFQLRQSTSGAIFWSSEFQMPDTDKLDFNKLNLISAKVANAIAPPLGALADIKAVNLARGSSSSEMANCLQRATYFWQPFADSELRNADDCIMQSISANPMSPVAWAAKAYYHLDNERFLLKVAKNTGEEIRKALAAAQQAYEINPNNIEAVRALYSAQFAMGNLNEFGELAKRALKLNPNNAYTLADIGRKSAYSGNWNAGLKQIQAAIGLTELPPDWFLLPVAHDHYRNGRYEQALATVQKARRGKFCGRYLVELASLVSLGKLDKARGVSQDLLRIFPDFEGQGHRLLTMWNFENELIEAYRSDLAAVGLKMERSTDDWRKVALAR